VEGRGGEAKCSPEKNPLSEQRRKPALLGGTKSPDGGIPEGAVHHGGTLGDAGMKKGGGRICKRRVGKKNSTGKRGKKKVFGEELEGQKGVGTRNFPLHKTMRGGRGGGGRRVKKKTGIHNDKSETRAGKRGKARHCKRKELEPAS